MTIKTVYVRAASKKAANELVLKDMCSCTEYDMYGSTGHNLRAMPTGTVVKIYDKFVDGSPYAKAYGTWDAEKKRIK
jgi:hypothetical protein